MLDAIARYDTIHVVRLIYSFAFSASHVARGPIPKPTFTRSIDRGQKGKIMTTVLITGNTFPVKDQLKSLGGRWDAASKGWSVPAEKADEARTLVSGAPRSEYSSPRKCRCCGKKELSWQEAKYLGKKTGMQHYPVNLRRDGICYDCASDN